MRFVSVNVVHPYSSTEAPSVWKKSRSILLETWDFLSIVVHTFSMCIILIRCTFIYKKKKKKNTNYNFEYFGFYIIYFFQISLC